MNRNVLKIVAFVTMIIDHIGLVFFPDIYVLRVVGRVSMPIFAFFVAEGYFYTKSKKKYVLTLLVFMLISWFPFCLGLGLPYYKVNILGIFLIAILGMFLMDKLRENKNNWAFWLSIIILYFTGVFILDLLTIIPEGFFGVLLPIIFYTLRKNKILMLIIAGVVLLAMSSINFLNGISGFVDFVQLFSLLSLIFLYFYNGEKGKTNLKYLFYVGYPLHLLIIYILALIIL